MPKYFEFVFAAYAIFVGVFVWYLAYLFLKSRRIERALQRLPGRKAPPGGAR